MVKPLLARFLYNKNIEEECWIQSKIEKVSNFCYKCGMISHVTRLSNLEKLVTILNGVGMIVTLYEPWLKVNNSTFMSFGLQKWSFH